MRPYQPGQDMGGISVSKEDQAAGSPKPGDMIARNPKNHAYQWLVAKVYFEDNLEEISQDAEAQHLEVEPMDIDADVKANKSLRKMLDEILQFLKVLRKSRERSLSITKLQESIMWLGMDLKRLNEPNPYPDSYDPSNTKIAPTADGLKF